MYTSRFNHSRFRERILEGYRLDCFSRVEGIDGDYLRHEIVTCLHASSLVYRIGVRIKRYIATLRGIAAKPRTGHMSHQRKYLM